MSLRGEKNQRWARCLDARIGAAERARPMVVEGCLTRMVGMTLEAAGCRAAIGERCHVLKGERSEPVEAEVVGFSGDKLLLMPISAAGGLSPLARVIPTGQRTRIGVGDGLLGRVLDGVGRALDGRGVPLVRARVPSAGRPINPLERAPIRQPLDVGVRTINALFTVGQGQRLGLFAPSGVGKSVLLGMMTRFTNADVIVVGLIGERGREVQEFISTILGEEGLARAVLVACPSDDPPLVRVHGAMLATSIAEYFRDRGCQVLLLMDSLTRFAQAHREIALAIGEPPATRGFPPSVFARLPQLVERAGNGPRGTGGITAIYTVLTEVDEHDDPLADAAKAILDGHIVLTRSLAEQGHFPAIDVEASVSRAMKDISSAEQQRHAQQFRRVHSTYSQNADLINVGAYASGSDPDVDHAISLRPAMTAFLNQPMRQPVTMAESLCQLAELIDRGARAQSDAGTLAQGGGT